MLVLRTTSARLPIKERPFRKKPKTKHVCREEIQQILRDCIQGTYTEPPETSVTHEHRQSEDASTSSSTPRKRAKSDNLYYPEFGKRILTPRLIQIALEKRKVLKEALEPFTADESSRASTSSSPEADLNNEPNLTEREEVLFNVPIKEVHSSQALTNLFVSLYHTSYLQFL